jgi:hypothetical protein
MAAQGQLVGFEISANTRSQTASVSLTSAVRWLAERIDAYADYRASAVLYEELRRLSDAELRRRGLRL